MAKIKYYESSGLPYGLYDLQEECVVFWGKTEEECRNYARKYGITIIN
jgi:hypothetical protein